MSVEAWVNVLLGLIGLIGLIGILASWPVLLLWIVLLAVGWGVLVIVNGDGSGSIWD